MPTTRARSLSLLTAGFALGGLLASCGGGDIVFPGDDGGGNDNPRTVTLKGNIDQVAPVTTRDIVVFAFNVADSDYTCPCPGDSSASLNGKAAVIASGTTEFTISGLDN